MRENIERSNSSRQRSRHFRIPPGILKSRHVFVFIINDANIGAQTANPFLYNTISGSSLGSLVNLGSGLLPMAMPLAKKAIAPIATGALSGLASLGVDKFSERVLNREVFLFHRIK